MATLSAAELEVVRDIYAKGTRYQGQARDVHNTACWNWALTGIVDQITMVRPEQLCDFVGRDSLNAQLARDGVQQFGEFHLDARNAYLNAAELAWFSIAINRQNIVSIRDTWNRSRKDASAILVSSKAIAKLAIQANGLTVVERASSYKICVYYYTHVTQPNFQHWWIEVEGVWFELFPTLYDIQVARDSQRINATEIVFSHSVLALHQTQVTRMVRAFEGYDGGWWDDHSTKVCTQCQSEFGVFTRKHHCRRCGKIFCKSCSSHTRVLPNIIQRPDSTTLEQGRVRVCDNCYLAP